MVGAKDVEAFLADIGWAGARRTALAGDASARRYERLTRDGETAVLMQAPADASIKAFIAIGRLLAKLGLSVPDTMAGQAEQGLLLLEDFGDETYTALLDGGAAPEPLYRLAVETLIHLHRQFDATVTGEQSLPEFDAAHFLELTTLYCDVCLDDLSDDARAEAAGQFEDAWRRPLELAMSVPRSLLLRDFHAGNLFHLPQRPSIRTCGLIDYQDAGLGPVTYDLVSLLQDARRDIPGDLAEDCVAQYVAAFPNLDADAFGTSLAVMAAQRHVRVIAVFTRLARQGKPGYLVHLPRLHRLLRQALAHPALGDVAAWFRSHPPAAI